jgi:hypothetical protein
LALKETTDSTKHVKKNKNYNEILKKPFIFNLHIVRVDGVTPLPHLPRLA